MRPYIMTVEVETGDSTGPIGARQQMNDLLREWRRTGYDAEATEIEERDTNNVTIFTTRQPL